MRRGLFESRERAARAIEAGQVLVQGSVADRASRLVSPAEAVTVSGPPDRFVSRGGEKLFAALETFAVPVDGRRVLDAGASTGGFTDCLLQHGARLVVAVDVGRGQLHPRLREDPRVEVHEGLNIRHLRLADLGGEPFEMVVADLSFISLRTVAPVLLSELAGPEADVVMLVKPQFEAGRAEVSRGRGVIRNPEVWREALSAVGSAVAGAGAAMMGAMVSPIRGAEGNVEFLLHARAHTPGASEVPGLERVIELAAGEG